jgi:hypothetical protein
MSDAFSLSPLVKSSSHFNFEEGEKPKSPLHPEYQNQLNIPILNSPPIFEMTFEKPEDFFCHEEEIIPYNTEELYLSSYAQEFTFSGDADFMKPDIFRTHTERNDAINLEETSECSSQKLEEEEIGSVSTRESIINGFNNYDGDSISLAFEDTFPGVNISEIHARVKQKALEITRNKTKQEREYIEKTLPFLIFSLQEAYLKSCPTLTDDMIEDALQQLLEGKKATLGAEADFMRRMIEEDITDIMKDRPNDPIDEDDLNLNHRKVKKMFKGNKNNSSLNHVNENYVSNIFQFAKKNFPEDKELQKLANERNVSAINFRRMMKERLTDTFLIRRAKARIIESGKELVSNIEYWMNEGYFDQCNEREKYIAQKEKALIDLALEEEH